MMFVCLFVCCYDADLVAVAMDNIAVQYNSTIF